MRYKVDDSRLLGDDARASWPLLLPGGLADARIATRARWKYEERARPLPFDDIERPIRENGKISASLHADEEHSAPRAAWRAPAEERAAGHAICRRLLLAGGESHATCRRITGTLRDMRSSLLTRCRRYYCDIMIGIIDRCGILVTRRRACQYFCI